MRVVIAMLAAATLLLGACNKCGPRDVPAAGEATPAVASTTVAKADVVPAPVAKPDGVSAESANKAIAPGEDKLVPQPKAKPAIKKLKLAPIRTCAQGQCNMRCDMLHRCLFSCDGGNCHQICGSESSCSATCDGGGCIQQCQASAGCNFRCSGGQCDQQCDSKAACSLTCDGKNCKVCQGKECTVEPL